MEQTTPASGAVGLLVATSRFSVDETIERLAAAVAAAGNTVFARFDHAQNANDAGLTLRPTKVLVFGNARAGTPLMQAVPEVAIDLPLRFVAWQGADGTTRLAWNDPLYLAARFGLAPDEPHLRIMADNLAKLAAALA